MSAAEPVVDNAPSLRSDDFRAAFRSHAAGVAIVTADVGDGPVGMTASSVISVSASPPLLVFSASELSSAASKITSATSVVIHLLGTDQLDLAKLCATGGIDRFADTTIWSRLETGEPRFLSAPTWIRGVIVRRYREGSSTLVVVHATHAKYPDVDDLKSARPLIYYNKQWHRLGGLSLLE